MQQTNICRNLFFLGNTFQGDNIAAKANHSAEVKKQEKYFQNITFMTTELETPNKEINKNDKELDIFLKNFIETISTKHFAELKDSTIEPGTGTKEINVVVKSDHYAKIVYWVKKNLMVKSFNAKRKSYITTIEISLNGGHALRINLI